MKIKFYLIIIINTINLIYFIIYEKLSNR